MLELSWCLLGLGKVYTFWMRSDQVVRGLECLGEAGCSLVKLKRARAMAKVGQIQMTVEQTLKYLGNLLRTRYCLIDVE